MNEVIFSLPVRKITLLLVCLVCVGNGRPVQLDAQSENQKPSGHVRSQSHEQVRAIDTLRPLKILEMLLVALTPLAASNAEGSSNVFRSIASSVSTSLGNSVIGWMERQARQRNLKSGDSNDVQLALLAARLSEVAYLETESKLKEQLGTPAFADVPGGLKILHFHQQGAENKKGSQVNPQWFLARGALPSWLGGKHESLLHMPGSALEDEDGTDKFCKQGGALYLVFRGTLTTTDAIRDLCIEPERHRDRGSFHGGFLKGVRDDEELHAQLRRAIRRGCDHLFIFGHSLGGSLAMTLVEADLLPSYTGPITVVSVGSPPVIAPKVTSGSSQASPVAQESCRKMLRHLLVINDSDVVPRLLGSPMPVTTAAMLAAAATSTSAQALMHRNVELLETMQQFSHPAGTEVLLLKDGRAKLVPCSDRAVVLHLHEALSPQLLEHHMIDKYVRALEISAALAEVFEEELQELGF